MSLESDIALLRGTTLFSALDFDQLRLLAFGSVRRHLLGGAVVFEEGTPANSAFLVASGEIKLTSTIEGALPDGQSLCGPGVLISELALFTETTRPATAVAEKRSEVVEITRSLMTRMLEEYPHLALHFRQRLAARLTATVAEMERVRQAFLIDKPGES